MSFDPAPYIEYHRRRNEHERARARVLAGAARAEAARLAAVIASDDPSVRAVILFGSLAEGEPTHTSFDVDLALVGGDVLRAMALTEESKFHVDVADFGRLPASVRTRILARGVVLSGVKPSLGSDAGDG